MKIFFKKIFFLLVPFLVLGGYTEYRLNGMDTMLSFKKQAAVNAPRGTDTLILGSSHALSGINPEHLTSMAFNFANVSQSLYYDAELLDRFLVINPSVKTLIVAISYFTLDYSMSNSPEDMRQYFYQRNFNIEPEGNMNPTLWKSWDFRKYSLVGLYGVERSFKYLRHNFRNKSIENMQESGWVGNSNNAKKPLNDQEGKDRVRLHESIMKEGLVGYNLGLLGRMSRKMLERSGRLFLVTTPVYASYSAHVNKTRYLEMKKSLEIFCKENECATLNYFTDSRFQAEDFYDVDHLNERGAAKLSRFIDHDVSASLNNVVDR